MCAPMKALILSAGQGRRLLPLTQDRPKSSLEAGGRSLLASQLGEFANTAISEVVVITGFAAEVLENIVARTVAPPSRTLYNPFYAHSDNLGTCWVAREEMNEPFLLVNGDTLFESAVVNRLLEGIGERPITLAMDRKGSYDDDDMKVIVDGRRLQQVGKQLPADRVNGESIGMMAFTGEGPTLFRRKLDQLMRSEEGRGRWYLSAIDELARLDQVAVQSIEGLSWCEVDDQEDLAHADTVVRSWPDVAALDRVGSGAP
jgi:choline kinase